MTLVRSILLAAGVCCGGALLAGSPPVLAEDAKPAAAPAPFKAEIKADPARIAAAKELLAAFGGLEQAKASVPQFVNALVAEIRSRDEKIGAPAEYFLRSETEPDKPRVKAYLAEVEAAATSFYADTFTVDEMKTITAFYTSAAGKKFQAETPKLLGMMAPMMARFQQSLIQDMQKGLSGGAAKEGAPNAPAPAAGDKK